MGSLFVPIALFGWIPVVLALFMQLPARRAVLASFLLAWLFLPIASYKLGESIPVYDKMSATCVGVLLGSLFFDTRRLYRFRPTLIDLPMLIWCFCPIASSLSNDLGVYDGIAGAFRQIVVWGLPYLIGRVYFAERESLRDLAVALVLGGLIYVPLCLFEIRMSPQLHGWVYGYYQHDFLQTIRLGGWRPTVFMQHGLMVGMWMCMTSLVGIWLWQAKALPKALLSIPTEWGVVALVLTALLCRSTGAIVLMVAGLGVFYIAKLLGSRVVLGALILAGPLYMTVRASGMWDGMDIVDLTRVLAGDERAKSILTRVTNEDELSAKAMECPAFGWGGWGRMFSYDEYGKTRSIPDGLWVISLGTNGLVGLVSLCGVMLLPAAVCCYRMTPAKWTSPQYAPVAALAVVSVLYLLDCISNAMVNPIFTLAIGGLASFTGDRELATSSPVVEPRRLRGGAGVLRIVHRNT